MTRPLFVVSALLLFPACIVQFGLGAAGEVRKATAKKPTAGTWAVTETIQTDGCGLKAALLPPTLTLRIDGEDAVFEELETRQHLDGTERVRLLASRWIDFRPDYECTMSERVHLTGPFNETEMDLALEYDLLYGAHACREGIIEKLGYADPDCVATGTVKLVHQSQ